MSLTLGLVGPVFAHPHSPEQVAAAKRAIAEFFAFTDVNWSQQGYSSAGQMREVLGNSQSDRLNEAARIGPVLAL